MIRQRAKRRAGSAGLGRPSARRPLVWAFSSFPDSRRTTWGGSQVNKPPRQSIDGFVTGSLAAATRNVPILLLAAIFAFPLAALAQGSNAPSRFQQYDSPQTFTPAVVPLGVKGGGRVKVVVVMASDSVAAARARFPDRALTRDERRSVEDQAAAQHAAIEPEIEGRGGHVLKRFRHALNGRQ